jgi:hypothetical protein
MFQLQFGVKYTFDYLDIAHNCKFYKSQLNHYICDELIINNPTFLYNCHIQNH